MVHLLALTFFLAASARAEVEQTNCPPGNTVDSSGAIRYLVDSDQLATFCKTHPGSPLTIRFSGAFCTPGACGSPCRSCGGPAYPPTCHRPDHPYSTDRFRFDVNQDGRVDNSDALALTQALRAYAGGTVPVRRQYGRRYPLDVNGDDLVTTTDLLLVIHYLRGQL